MKPSQNHQVTREKCEQLRMLVLLLEVYNNNVIGYLKTKSNQIFSRFAC